MFSWLFHRTRAVRKRRRLNPKKPVLQLEPLEARSLMAVSPIMLLPGDTARTAAPGTQETPRIASGSSGFLTVWADTRSALNGANTSGPYDGPGRGTMLDIYAARLDAAGNVIDRDPIVISQA